MEKSVRKSADILKRKSLVYHSTDFHVTPTDFLKKNRPTTTDFSIFVCLWKSVGKIVWWELGFSRGEKAGFRRESTMLLIYISYLKGGLLILYCYIKRMY